MAKPDRVIFREPSLRTFAVWTPALVRAAEATADAGSLRLAADLCDAILADDRVQGVLGTRTKGLLALPLAFEAGGDKRRSGRAIRELEADEDFWAMFPEASLGQLLDWGVLLNVALGELAWSPRDNGREIGRLVPRHPRWLRQDGDGRWWRRVAGAGGLVDREVLVTPGDGRHVLYCPSGAERPWARGAWRALGRWWLLKEYAIQDFAQHSEVHGSPLRVGLPPEKGSSEKDRKELAADLQDLGTDTGMVLPPGWDLKLVEATARTWEMFRAQIDLANAGMTIALAGQNLTTEVSSGSLAAAQVHAVVRHDLLEADDQALATTLHDQALVHWASYNFGDPRLAPWPLHDTAPPEDRKAKADTLGVLGDAIPKANAALAAQGSDQEVDAEALLTGLGVPLRKRPVPPPPPPVAPEKAPPDAP